ncbi:hypothetical protein DFAR_1470025 [Desulfarculales bacterium]
MYSTINRGYGTKSGKIYRTEDTPLEPISKYGVDKVPAELELLNGPNVITLRLATGFGFSFRIRMGLLSTTSPGASSTTVTWSFSRNTSSATTSISATWPAASPIASTTPRPWWVGP